MSQASVEITRSPERKKIGLLQDNKTSQPPVIIVGNGPVGVRTMTELFNRDRKIPVVLYGDETHLPYDRVKLSLWLTGELALNQISNPYRRPFGSSLDERFGRRVVSIDRQEKTILDSTNETTVYEKLILATGSKAYVPEIEGINNEGVFTLRNIDDATSLFARRNRSRHTVVIGGGLLGLEAARSMQPANTKVTVIEHSDRLMANQLDVPAALLLRETLEAKGFSFVVGDGIKRILGDPRVSAVQTNSGKTIECDTIIVATGIKPNIELAKNAGLEFGRGIKVNNYLQTSDPAIYAVGECAEHQREVYGLVAPGFEQASAAANHVAGNQGEYRGSVLASRLKVVGTPVFSVGPVGHTANTSDAKSISYYDDDSGIYRKLLVKRHRLVGAVGIGDWDQSIRVQSAISSSKRLYLWQTLRFTTTGNLWSAESANAISAWPDNTIICQCNNVSKGAITSAIETGSTDVAALGRSCRAGMVCGSCKPQLNNLLGNKDALVIKGSNWLLGISLIATAAVLAILLFPPVQYAMSVQPTEMLSLTLSWHWDTLWRSALLKKISGFTVLGAAFLASILSIRKRFKRLHSLGQFDGWRVAHLVFSGLALLALLFHTGFRMGHGLNFALMSLFVALVALGIVTTLIMTIGRPDSTVIGERTKRLSLKMHIYLFWPIPLLLGWHIFKGYWY